MFHSSRITRKPPRLSLSALVLVSLLTFNRDAEAELTLIDSSGSTTYSVYKTTSTYPSNFSDGSGAIPKGQLIYPGAGMPALSTQVPNSQQMDAASSLSPYFLSTATTTPGDFGSAVTEVYVATSGQQGSYTTQGGIYWSLKTSLADNLSGGSSLASVTFSTATAYYANDTSSAITINPGAILSIVGTLGDSSSYIAAGLSTSITVYGDESSTTTNLDPIILAANGKGTSVSQKGDNPKEYASVTISGSKVTGIGTSLSSPVTLQPFDSIQITSNLTLISDPYSEIGITNSIPSDLTFLPDFGTFASSPSAIVPEPTSMILLGSGLAMVALVGRSRRRRTVTPA